MEKKKGCLSIIGNIFKVIGILFVILIIIALLPSKDTNNKQTTITKEAILYNDNNIIFKITGYEITKVIKGIELSFYMENNTDKDVTFYIDDDVIINGYTYTGDLFSKNVKANTKANGKYSISNALNSTINNSEIDFNNLKSITLEYSVHEGEIISTKDYADKQKFTFEF